MKGIKMYGLATALPQKLKNAHAKTESGIAKTDPKTKRVFKGEIACPTTMRAIAKAEAEYARGEFFTLEELEAKYLK